jgi:hypothetical protein
MVIDKLKLVVFVPSSHADLIRETLGLAGAGVIGKYSFCSFSSKGVGRFKGNSDSTPAIGRTDAYEAVEEERIEVLVPKEKIKTILEKLREVHPYEEIAYDLYPLLALTGD